MGVLQTQGSRIRGWPEGTDCQLCFALNGAASLLFLRNAFCSFGAQSERGAATILGCGFETGTEGCRQSDALPMGVRPPHVQGLLAYPQGQPGQRPGGGKRRRSGGDPERAPSSWLQVISPAERTFWITGSRLLESPWGMNRCNPSILHPHVSPLPAAAGCPWRAGQCLSGAGPRCWC